MTIVTGSQGSNEKSASDERNDSYFSGTSKSDIYLSLMHLNYLKNMENKVDIDKMDLSDNAKIELFENLKESSDHLDHSCANKSSPKAKLWIYDTSFIKYLLSQYY